MTEQAISLVRCLENAVQPALFHKLDVAFPEFGWKRTAREWIAADRAFTKERFGARIRSRPLQTDQAGRA